MFQKYLWMVLLSVVPSFLNNFTPYMDIQMEIIYRLFSCCRQEIPRKSIQMNPLLHLDSDMRFRTLTSTIDLFRTQDLCIQSWDLLSEFDATKLVRDEIYSITIHGYKDGNYIPLVFMLLPGKPRKSIILVFLHLSNFVQRRICSFSLVLKSTAFYSWTRQ
jgi:hypothetical protein